MATLIGDYVTLEEAVKSQEAVRRGISNVPTEEQILNAVALCETVYDPLCRSFGVKLPFNSFFRCKRLNRAIGGSVTSQHCDFSAIDIDGDGLHVSHPDVTNVAIFERVQRLRLPFDQLIWEFGTDDLPAWVHVSHNRTGRQRGQILRSKRDSAGNTYYFTLNPVT